LRFFGIWHNQWHPSGQKPYATALKMHGEMTRQSTRDCDIFGLDAADHLSFRTSDIILHIVGH
jgi:hypothetical protein